MSALPVAINNYELAAVVNHKAPTSQYEILAKGADDRSHASMSPGKHHSAVSLDESENRQTALSYLNELAKLKHNWDACGADAIDEICVSNAKTLIAALPRKCPSPEIFPNPNGTLTLDWETNGQTLSLELGKSRFSSFWETKHGTKMAEGEINKNIPDFIYIALQEMFQDITSSPEQIQTLVMEDEG